MIQLWERSFAVANDELMAAALEGKSVRSAIGTETAFLVSDTLAMTFVKRAPFPGWGKSPAGGWLYFWARLPHDAGTLHVYQLPVDPALHDRLSSADGSSRQMFREDVFLDDEPQVRIRSYGLLNGRVTIATFSFESESERDRFTPPRWCGSPVSNLAIHALNYGPDLSLIQNDAVNFSWHRIESRDKQVALEVERRFLVDRNLLPPLRDPKKIVQAYLVTDEKSPVRIRITDADLENALITIKGPRVGVGRLEYQGLLPRQVGELFVQACPNVVVKDRYLDRVGESYWEIDIFRDANAPLVIAEVEGAGEDGENQLRDIELPPYCAQEILDTRYNNEVLARYPFGIHGESMEA